MERIRGLVAASGGTKGSSRIGDRWYHSLGLSLAAWRTSDGAVHRGNRRCDLVLASEDEGLRIPAYAIVDLELAAEGDATRQVPPHPNPLFASTRSTTWLQTIVAVDVSDVDLEQIRAELQVPVRITHPGLGEFEYDRRIHSFKGVIEWSGRQVAFWLGCSDPTQPQAVLAHAEALASDWPAWQRRAASFAATSLLELKNDTWIGEDDDGNELPPVTHDQFVERLTPNSLGIEEDGSVSFWYDDGDLFFGHSIHVDGHISGELQDAGIAG